MNCVVCIKRVPETAEAMLKIDSSRKKIEEGNLSFAINEADNYALEAALLIKEKFGGEVVLVTIGPAASDEVLRMGLAKGADRAVRITPLNPDELDPHATASLLADAIKGIEYDIILAGCMASDDGSAQVGVALAEHLGIPHLSLVVAMTAEDEKRLNVRRELEGGMQEEFELKLPALCTIQTGINEPRYASILGIKRAGAKEIKVVDGVQAGQIRTRLRALDFPPPGKMAEIIQGTPAEAAAKVGEILKSRGLL